MPDTHVGHKLLWNYGELWFQTPQRLVINMKTDKIVILIILFLSLFATAIPLGGDSEDVRDDFGVASKRGVSLNLLDEEGDRVFQYFFYNQGSGLEFSTLVIAKTYVDKDGESYWELICLRKFHFWIKKISFVSEENKNHLEIEFQRGKKKIIVDLGYNGQLKAVAPEK